MTETDRTYTSNLVAFCTALREHGIHVSPDDTVSAARALAEIDPLDRDQFYYGLKATLVDEPVQEDVFADLFERYWDELAAEEGDAESSSETGKANVEEYVAEEGAGGDEKAEGIETEPPDDSGSNSGAMDAVDDLGDLSERRSDERTSGPENGAEDDVALEIGRQERSTRPPVAFEDDRLATEELSLLVKELGRQLGTLRGFRHRIQPSGKLDLRRSLNLAREKNPSNLPRIEKEQSQAKVRFFVDVSHSMLRNMHQEFLLLFLFECSRQYADVRIFLFDTDTAEVTWHFQAADIDRTLTDMHRAQTRWGAGTTIGACLEDILTMDPFVVDNDTIAVIISDGWDAGDLDRLQAQMMELDRRCRTVVWFNPRASTPNYEPKVGGIETALPYTDYFFGFESLDDLRHIVAELRSRTSRLSE